MKLLESAFSDLYTDFLICSTGQTSCTVMGEILDIKHDKLTQNLTKWDFDSRFLWRKSKPYYEELRKSSEIKFLRFDDSIEAKPYTDESELICWHFDHTQGKSVKGVCFLTALIEVDGMRLPCSVSFVKKDLLVKNEKTGKTQRKASKSKNEMFLEMVTECDGKVSFDYILADSWYSSQKNMWYFKTILKRNFIMPLKNNRLVSLSEDKNEFVNIKTLELGQQAVEVWLKGLDFPLLLTKQVFKNGDGTVGELYLVSSDLNLSYELITTYYKKRWAVEEFHKSIKSNTSFSKSPTKTIRTQCNHFVLSIVAYIKLEFIKLRTNMNHFAMKRQLYIAAVKAAYDEMKKLSTPKNSFN